MREPRFESPAGRAGAGFACCCFSSTTEDGADGSSVWALWATADGSRVAVPKLKRMAQLIFMGTSIIQFVAKQISEQISSRLRENFRALGAWAGKRLGVRHCGDEEIPAPQRAGNSVAVLQW